MQSIFDEAREKISEWEREFPHMDSIVLIGDAPDDLLVSPAGEHGKPSCVAGLCFAAAQLMLRDDLA